MKCRNAGHREVASRLLIQPLSSRTGGPSPVTVKAILPAGVGQNLIRSATRPTSYSEEDLPGESDRVAVRRRSKPRCSPKPPPGRDPPCKTAGCVSLDGGAALCLTRQGCKGTCTNRSLYAMLSAFLRSPSGIVEMTFVTMSAAALQAQTATAGAANRCRKGMPRSRFSECQARGCSGRLSTLSTHT